MNGNVFIGWCGSNKLAAKVSESLTEKKFKCIVGGNYEETDNVYIGGTILNQLNNCNQAIFIVQKNTMGIISNNIIFEIGFSLSRFNVSAKKLHLFYLDIDPKDKSIPSDLLGAWAEHIDTKNLTEDQLVEDICNRFIREQKMQVLDNKMALINDWYSLSDKIAQHFTSPTCSDFEMAQYLLFYSVSSGFINIFSQMKECISLLRKNVDEESEELYNAFKLASTIHEVGTSVKRKDNVGYLDDSIYISASEMISEILEWIGHYEPDEFTKGSDFPIWFEMIAKQRQGYVSMMYVNNPELVEEERKDGYEEAIKFSEQTIELCDKLKKIDPKNNRELASLYKSFAERNIAVAYDYLGNSEMERVHKLRSFEEKKYLREYSKNLNLDTRMADSFERGYYLSMAEIIKYEEDPRKKRAYLKEIDAYAEYMLTVRDSSNQYVNRIKLMLESQNTKGV